MVISQGWCLSVKRDGCAMPELWDLEDKVTRDRCSTFSSYARRRAGKVIGITKDVKNGFYVCQMRDINSKSRGNALAH